MPRYRFEKKPFSADPPFEGRKPSLNALGAVMTVNTINYGSCRPMLGWRTLVAKVKDGCTTPGVVRPAQPRRYS